MKKSIKKVLDMVSEALLVVGGLNLGLGVFGFNVVNAVFGGAPVVEQMVYGLVGLSAVWHVAKKFV